VLGVVYKLNPAVNLYASAARGFETPTLNEMFYSIRRRRLQLRPQALAQPALRDRRQGLRRRGQPLNLALFQIATEDELVVAASADGRTSYKNAGKTLRQGVEASFDTAWQRNLSSRFAVSHLRAIYDEAIGATSRPATACRASRAPPCSATWPGSRCPASPPPSRPFTAARCSSKTPTTPPAATPAPALLRHRQPAPHRRAAAGPWRFTEFARIDNLFDRQYIGSVVVGDGNGRYYEPAPAVTGWPG
jgi:iron complex outermembrane receptor protein